MAWRVRKRWLRRKMTLYCPQNTRMRNVLQIPSMSRMLREAENARHALLAAYCGERRELCGFESMYPFFKFSSSVLPYASQVSGQGKYRMKSASPLKLTRFSPYKLPRDPYSPNYLTGHPHAHSTGENVRHIRRIQLKLRRSWTSRTAHWIWLARNSLTKVDRNLPDALFQYR